MLQATCLIGTSRAENVKTAGHPRKRSSWPYNRQRTTGAVKPPLCTFSHCLGRGVLVLKAPQTSHHDYELRVSTLLHNDNSRECA